METVLAISLTVLLVSSSLGSTLPNDDNGPKDLGLLDFRPQKDLMYPSMNEDSVVQRFRFHQGPDGKVRRVRYDSSRGLDEDSPGIRVYGLPKKSFEDSGSIERIPLVSSRFAEENKPGIQAYGLPKKTLENSGNIERIPNLPRFAGDPRSGRLIEAYGMPKRNFDDNGRIERVQISASPRAHVGSSMINQERGFKDLEGQDEEVIKPIYAYRQQSSARRRNGRLVEAYGMPRRPLNDNQRVEMARPVFLPRVEAVERPTGFRITRSIDTENKNELEDLEGQDAKVFRPLFVYRQQVAARQRRLEKKRKTNPVQRYPPQPRKKPYVYKSYN